MSTVSFNLFTRPFATSNKVRVALFKTTSPLAEISHQDKTGPLGTETWVFPGLERVPTIVRINEVIGSTVGQLYDEFTFIPDNADPEFKDPIYIEAGVSLLPGGDGAELFPSGVNSVTIPALIGWDIQFAIPGQGEQYPGFVYDWDAVTGTITLLQEGASFEMNGYYIFIALPRYSVTGATAAVQDLFSGTVVLTTSSTLTSGAMGKKHIVKGTNITTTLPGISTVPENRVLYIECARNVKAHTVAMGAGDTADWKEGNLSNIFMSAGDTLELYREVIDADTDEWRVHSYNGNFFTVGNRFYADQIQAGRLNGIYLDGGGSTGILKTDYERLYDYVLSLPGSQVCAYSAWGTGNNRYLFSLKDVVTGRFHIPDTRDKYTRNTSSGKTAGTYQDHAMMQHRHLNVINDIVTDSRFPSERGTALTKVRSIQNGWQKPGGESYVLDSKTDEPTIGRTSKMSNEAGDLILANIDTENRPVSVLQNEYVLY